MKQGKSAQRAWLVACLAVAGLGYADVAWAQPSNDDCSSAIVATDGTYNGTTVGASNDGTGTCGASDSSPDVWYVYQASMDGQLNVETCGSTYDTVLGIWSGCPGSGSEMTCNDDACDLQSTTFATIGTGEIYYIRVSGYGGATGSFTLTLEAVEGGGGGSGADVIYVGIGGISNYGTVGGIRGYALGSQTCNIGDQDLAWNNNGTPGFGMNAYRLWDGRLEQIGMSWVKHACCAAAGSGCGMACNGHGGNVLGVGCLDVYSSGWNGGQGYLGKRSDINPFTGPVPPATGGSGDAIYKRLQIKEADMDQAPSGALYFVEGVYVGTDDALSSNWLNNASYQQVSVGGSYNLSLIGGTFEEGSSAIYAWQEHDPAVDIAFADVFEEGRFIVAGKASDNGNGTWRYTYAAFNLNSNRCAASFSVPIPADATVTNEAFHDVDYHSGEPATFNDDWVITIDSTSVTWSSPETYVDNPDTNALRWGTMYTFWFDVYAEPANGDVTLGLFRPGSPSSVTATLPVPLTTTGPDCNGNGIEDDCDIDCGPPEGACDVPGCGGSIDTNGNGIPDDCETGACCDHALGMCLVDGVFDSDCDVIAEQPEFFLGITCAQVDSQGLCWEHTGACCDKSQPGGVCVSGVPESQCNPTGNPQIQWYKDEDCVEDGGTIDCAEHTGACCDRRIADPALRCLDNVPESQCPVDDPTQKSWTKDTLCVDLDPPCTEHTGACCDKSQPGGVCVSGVPESQCNPTGNPQIQWYKDEGCVEDGGTVDCAEHTGACCDRRIADPALRCLDSVPESQCPVDDPTQKSWTKDTLCADLDPPCTEHTGACCDHALGACIGSLAESDCIAAADQPEFFKDMSCADVEGQELCDHTCVVVSACYDDDQCTTHECDEGTCVDTYRSRPRGDVTPFGSAVPPCSAEDQATMGDGFTNMLDVFCAFNAFTDGFPYLVCPCADVAPCAGDGFVNMLDVFAIFSAFSSEVVCPAPCP